MRSALCVHLFLFDLLQVNGGTIADKVDFGYSLFEKAVTVDR